MDNRFLITNDFGNYSFLTNKQFYNLLKDQMDPSDDDEKKTELIEKGFIGIHGQEQFLTQHANKLIDMKSYLFHAPSLHIFVVTTACNGDCVYCQAQSHHTGTGLMMEKETAEKAIDLVLSSPSPYITIEFQGGEPLLNFDLIRFIVETVEQKQTHKKINFSIVSNLTKITEEMIAFFQEHQISISTSLDGNADIQNYNRPMKNRQIAMYPGTISGIQKIQAHHVQIGAIQTTTAYSLTKADEIVDQYVSLHLNSIFIRPLTPLGMAYEQWNQIRYDNDILGDNCIGIERGIPKTDVLGVMTDFTHKGKQCKTDDIRYRLYVWMWCRPYKLRIFLKKILLQCAENYMELRSPCGAGLGQMAYYPNGDIYTCDEARMLAEMGNHAFKMGNVATATYQNLISSNACSVVCKYSILESLPSCHQCVYQPYCGVCPVISYAAFHDVTEKYPNHYRCAVYKGILDVLFELIQSEENRKIFLSWIEE